MLFRSKTLATTLSDTEPEDNFGNEDDRILNAVTASVGKLYKLVTKKLNDVELDREELSIKFDKAYQTIGALRFENNFLAKKTKKLKAELFQVRVQLERASSAKLDEMLSI